MLTEWIAREGGIVLSWWALATLAGVAIFPLCARLLSGLPDRGYIIARPVGILVTGFVFWLLASFGFLSNTPGSMVLAWLIVGVLSLIVFYTLRGHKNTIDWRAWWRHNRSGVIAAEIVFAVLLVGWCIVRTYQNGILYTEKDMELAFISAVMRSDSYPPNDPWMSGYAISYYYFGYVIAGMMSLLSGINSTTGFNLTTAMTFALTGLGTFGVVYNLVRSRARRFDNDENSVQARPRGGTAVATGLVGIMLVLLMGNWQTLMIELPYQSATASTEYLEFFDSDQRQVANTQPNDAVENWGYWYWFRSSRVLNDRDLTGNRQEVIDEFPAFSFLLADNHPHVMSLPFTLVALTLALNTLLMRRAPRGLTVLFYAICLGGLIFLNTWDGPIYMIAVIAADALRRFIRNGGTRLTAADYFGLITLGISIVGLSVLLYLPFLIGFRSQLGGVLPNLQYPTLFQQFFIHFAPFLIILSIFLAVEIWRGGRRINWRAGIIAALTALGGLLALMAILIVVASFVPSLRDVVTAFVDQNGGWGALLPDLLTKRLTHGLTALFLTIGVLLVAARLFPRVFSAAKEADPENNTVITYPAATGFVLLLIGLGIMLTLSPEFVYLRDNFSTRMNTIFKFYYQAWVLFGVASAYALYTIISDIDLKVPAPIVRAAVGGISVFVITGGLLFTIFGVYSRVQVETGRNSFPEDDPPLTLDGAQSFVRAGLISPDDFAAVQCLSAQVIGDDAVVVEAVGNSYGWGYGRVGTLTGIPILYNWGGHQSQWRGSTFGEIAGSREGDIERLYTDPTWNSARSILAQYGIDYVFFGNNERVKYSADETKFRDNLEIVCEFGETRVYRVDARVLAAR